MLILPTLLISIFFIFYGNAQSSTLKCMECAGDPYFDEEPCHPEIFNAVRPHMDMLSKELFDTPTSKSPNVCIRLRYNMGRRPTLFTFGISVDEDERYRISESCGYTREVEEAHQGITVCACYDMDYCNHEDNMFRPHSASIYSSAHWRRGDLVGILVLLLSNFVMG